MIGDWEIRKPFRITSFVKTKPTKRVGLLYYIFMDLYLENFDLYRKDTIKIEPNCFWARSFNTGLMGFTDKKTIPKVMNILRRTSCLGIHCQSKHRLEGWACT